jgi:RNA polymerase sigma-32 factor
MRGPSFDLRRCAPMTREEEHLCALEYAKTKSPFVASRLIAANMRLVVKIAYSYHRPQYDIADLVQEGNLGSCTASSNMIPTGESGCAHTPPGGFAPIS